MKNNSNNYRKNLLKKKNQQTAQAVSLLDKTLDVNLMQYLTRFYFAQIQMFTRGWCQVFAETLQGTSDRNLCVVHLALLWLWRAHDFKADLLVEHVKLSWSHRGLRRRAGERCGAGVGAGITNRGNKWSNRWITIVKYFTGIRNMLIKAVGMSNNETCW